MTWMEYVKSIVRYFLAVQLRRTVRSRTASALSRLDDRLLADIGVPRHRIAEYARAVAHMSVPVPPMPNSAHRSVTERLRSWRKRRAAIRELSALDDRLLRDIGIERGWIDDMVDAALNHRHDFVAAHPVGQLPDAVQEIPVPARNRPRIPAVSVEGSRLAMDSAHPHRIGTERMPDVHALQPRAANECRPPERHRRATANM